jgi:hypothetical protein
MDTKEQQELRAHCMQCIGFILQAVKDHTDLCRADALEVATILTQLLNSGKVKEADAQALAI